VFAGFAGLGLFVTPDLHLCFGFGAFSMSSVLPYWRRPHAAITMVVQLEDDGLERRFWTISLVADYSGFISMVKHNGL
jgi:hypothetical protein